MPNNKIFSPQVVAFLVLMVAVFGVGLYVTNIDVETEKSTPAPPTTTPEPTAVSLLPGEPLALTQTEANANGTSFMYPAEWTLQSEELLPGAQTFVLQPADPNVNSGVQFFVPLTAADLELLLQLPATGENQTPTDYIEILKPQLAEGVVLIEDTAPYTAGNYTGSTIVVQGANGDFQQIGFVTLTETQFILFFAGGSADNFGQTTATFRQILAGLTYTPPAVVPTEEVTESAAEPTEVPTAETTPAPTEAAPVEPTESATSEATEAATVETTPAITEAAVETQAETTEAPTEVATEASVAETTEVATTEATPEATATATPEVTVEPTTEATEIATAEATPEPTPEMTEMAATEPVAEEGRFVHPVTGLSISVPEGYEARATGRFTVLSSELGEMRLTVGDVDTIARILTVLPEEADPSAPALSLLTVFANSDRTTSRYLSVGTPATAIVGELNGATLNLLNEGQTTRLVLLEAPDGQLIYATSSVPAANYQDFVTVQDEVLTSVELAQ